MRATRQDPAEVTLQSWNVTEQPWERVHIDHAGPFQGHTFLIITDSMSKWVEVELVESTDSKTTIQKLQTCFARLGIPKMLVSDNAAGFTSHVFADFMKRLGIKHVRSTPHHPKTNGLAERMVQFIKTGLKSQSDDQPMQTKLDKILLKYRITPHCSTGESPCQLLFGRKIRTRFDNLRPSVTDVITENQEKSAKNDLPMRSFSEGDTVLVKDYRGNKEQWLPCTVEARTAATSYRVRTADGATWRRHADQMRTTEVQPQPTREFDADVTTQPRKAKVPQPVAVTPATSDHASTHKPQVRSEPALPAAVKKKQTQAENVPAPSQRPTRDRKLPSKFNDFVLT